MPSPPGDSAQLRRLLDDHPLTRDLVVRPRGSKLVVGRNEPPDPFSDGGFDPRVCFTRIAEGNYGLSVRRHTGRWEKTPFAGSLPDLVDVVRSQLQHLIAES